MSKIDVNIYSLNVNQFNGLTNWQNLSEEDMINNWIRNKDYIFIKIRSWLINKNNIIFLHEVPNNMPKNLIIHESFINECKVNGWNLYEADYDLPNKSHFKSVAIHNGNYEKLSILDIDNVPTNRIIMVRDVERKAIYVGIHIPSNDNDEYCIECIEQLNKIYEKYHNEYCIVYIGDTNIDFNCYNEIKDWPKRYVKFNDLLSANKLCDGWIKKIGKSKIKGVYEILFNKMPNDQDEDFIKLKTMFEKNNVNVEDYFIDDQLKKETFVGHTRIDKIILSENINNKNYCISYDDNIRYSKHSDHSAICLTIQDTDFFTVH